MGRIGVFGGSFDPIHHGHLIAAVTIRETLGLDEVRLVVAREQPLKEGGHDAEAGYRATMVELSVEGVPGLRADRRELGRSGASYTVETLRELRAEEPGASLVLLLGSDAARDLPRWREPEALRELARVVVFGRGVEPGELQVPRVDISSTEIRARVRAGKSIRYRVPDAVADYIARHRLYREGV
jgi:nicotinate-nucleotide adenylyltransferase